MVSLAFIGSAHVRIASHGGSASRGLGAPPSCNGQRKTFAEPEPASAGSEDPAEILLVDDDPTILRAIARQLQGAGYVVDTAPDGAEAVRRLQRRSYDSILSDISMPHLDGIEMLRAARAHDLHVPVVLLTGHPRVDTAVKALELGAFHYLTKPVASSELLRVLRNAVRTRRMLRARQEAHELLGDCPLPAADRAGLEAAFDTAMRQLWVAYQPIVSAQDRSIFGYEALVRSHYAALPQPQVLIQAAETLGRLNELGRTIRDLVARDFSTRDDGTLLFVNLRPSDLLDPALVAPDAALSALADRVVLEITERTSLETVRDMNQRIADLRAMGFRVAVDDLGAGYAGLTSFAQLQPEFVKLDMSLIRDVHLTPVKHKVVRSVTLLARDMGIKVVAEGIECVEERDAVVELGCDLLQGFHFARPGLPFPSITW